MDMIHSVWGGLHTIAAILGLITGFMVLRRPKGDRRHKSVGYVYVVLMSVLVLAGIPMAENGLSAFHYLSMITGGSIVGAMVMIWLARIQTDPRKRANFVFGHYKFMVWSYIGLVAAGVAQIASRIAGEAGGMASFWWAVLVASLVITGVGALWVRLSDPGIKRRYARALDGGAS